MNWALGVFVLQKSFVMHGTFCGVVWGGKRLAGNVLGTLFMQIANKVGKKIEGYDGKKY